jgi:hypothetical protein
MSTSAETTQKAPEPPPPAKKKADALKAAYPFGAPLPEVSPEAQKEADLEKSYEAYRAKVSEDGRALRSFDQLSAEDKTEFATSGKLGDAEAGRMPAGIHAVRTPGGQFVLVTRDDRPLYVAKDKEPLDVNQIQTLPAGNHTPYGNFTIVDGLWAYKGALLFTLAPGVTVDQQSKFSPALV